MADIPSKEKIKDDPAAAPAAERAAGDCEETKAMQALDEENKKFKLEQEYKKKQLLLALALKKTRELRADA